MFATMKEGNIHYLKKKKLVKREKALLFNALVTFTAMYFCQDMCTVLYMRDVILPQWGWKDLGDG